MYALCASVFWAPKVCISRYPPSSTIHELPEDVMPVAKSPLRIAAPGECLEVDIYLEGREPFGIALQQLVKLKMADRA